MKKILLLGLTLFFPVLVAYAKEYNGADIRPCPQDQERFCDSEGNFMAGAVETYYPDKTLKFEGTFVDGKMDGIQKYYHENGNLGLNAVFKNGIFSESQEYDKDKNITIKTEVKNGNVLRWEYDKKGNLRLEQNFISPDLQSLSKQGTAAFGMHADNGVIKEYDEHHKLAALINLKDGNTDYKRYFENGQLQIEIHIKDDKVVFYQSYDDKGNKTDTSEALLYTYVELFVERLNYPEEMLKTYMDLYHAAEAGNLEKVKELVQKGKDVNMVCNDICQGWTPVMIASANGHLDTVKFLLEQGANPNVQNRAGRTALMFATRYRFKPIVETLLDYGADPTLISQDENQNSAMADALTFSLMDPSAYEILKILVKRTGNVNFNFWDFTPLMLAVRNDDYDFAKYLLDNGANPNHFKTVEKDGKKEEYRLEDLAKSDKMKELIFSYRKKK